jgi:hypothetical protein
MTASLLSRIDRVQLVVPSLDDASAAFARLLDAETVHEDALAPPSARRRVLRLGESEIDLLAPDGAGAAADFLSATGGGLYSVGFAAPDLGALRQRFAASGLGAHEERTDAGPLLFLTPEDVGVPGLRCVVAQAGAPRRACGLVRFVYEATLLLPAWKSGAERFAAGFGLEPAHFVPIRSEAFGYEGTLTLFDPGRLDRVEIIDPVDRAKTMGRFFERRGPCLYMAYVESDDTAAIRERLREHAPRDWTGPREGAPGATGAAPDNLFVHPRALAGLLLGVSRTSFAWTWSGHPERVRP